MNYQFYVELQQGFQETVSAAVECRKILAELDEMGRDYARKIEWIHEHELN